MLQGGGSCRWILPEATTSSSRRSGGLTINRSRCTRRLTMILQIRSPQLLLGRLAPQTPGGSSSWTVFGSRFPSSLHSHDSFIIHVLIGVLLLIALLLL